MSLEWRVKMRSLLNAHVGALQKLNGAYLFLEPLSERATFVFFKSHQSPTGRTLKMVGCVLQWTGCSTAVECRWVSGNTQHRAY